jgi:MFS family permease
MWELYAMWAWLGLFLGASLEAHGGGSYLGLNAPAATFVTMGVGGALGAYAGGALADRWGRTTLTMAAMALSGLTAATIGLTFGGPPAVTFFLALLWGVTVIADSAQFSTAVTELCPPAYVGTALTAQTCVGFALTIISIWLIPPVVRLVGWHWAFALLAPGPALGVLAMARLRCSPEAVRMAGGRR